MKKTAKKVSKVKKIITNHLKDNLKSYMLVSLFLLIGIVLGVFFINSINSTQQQEIQSYLTNFTNSLKDGAFINNMELLKKSLINNFVFSIFIWFVGSTIIGIPIVIGTVAFRGFCLGYTISVGIAIWGIGKGIMFFVTSILLQNIIFIPCMLALAVSGIKLYQSIIKDKRKENIKFEIFRHTMFSFIILIGLVISSILESYLSSNLLMMCIPYF